MTTGASPGRCLLATLTADRRREPCVLANVHRAAEAKAVAVQRQVSTLPNAPWRRAAEITTFGGAEKPTRSLPTISRG